MSEDGYKNFQETKKTPQKSRRQKGNMKHLHAEEPQILDAMIQNLVARSPRICVPVR